MVVPYVLSKEAVEDIEDIFEFGEHKFVNVQAITYLMGLSELFEKLSLNLDMGRKRSEIKTGLLSISYHSHIVFYRKLESRIRIVRVLYGGRDLLKVFD